MIRRADVEKESQRTERERDRAEKLTKQSGRCNSNLRQSNTTQKTHPHPRLRLRLAENRRYNVVRLHPRVVPRMASVVRRSSRTSGSSSWERRVGNASEVLQIHCGRRGGQALSGTKIWMQQRAWMSRVAHPPQRRPEQDECPIGQSPTTHTAQTAHPRRAPRGNHRANRCPVRLPGAPCCKRQTVGG